MPVSCTMHEELCVQVNLEARKALLARNERTSYEEHTKPKEDLRDASGIT